VSESAAIDVENVWQRARCVAGSPRAYTGDSEHESAKDVRAGTTTAFSSLMAGVVVKSMLSRQNSGHSYF